MTDNGWINWPTENFYLCLVNDQQELENFRVRLLEEDLSVPWLRAMAKKFSIVGYRDFESISFYSIVLNLLVNDESIPMEERDLLVDYIKNSPFFTWHQRIAQEEEVEHNFEFKPVPAPREEQNTMMKVETKHFVNDKDITSYSTEERIDLIAQTEAQLSDLGKIEAHSKMVKAEIEKTKQFLADITRLFDADL